MRIFAADRMDGMLQKLGLKEGEAIVHSWINKALERAQQKVEARNFEIRKNLLKYDNVMNDQRKVIYEQRRDIMKTDDVSAMIIDMREEIIDELVTRCIPPNAYAEQWDIPTLHTECLRLFNLDLPVADWAKEEGIADEEIRDRIKTAVTEKMAAKAANYGPEMMRLAEKSLLLQILDQLWKDHLLSLDHLRQGIGLRAYAQRDPLNEYKREAFGLFETMLDRLRETITSALCHLEMRVQEPGDGLPDTAASGASGLPSHPDPALMAEADADGTVLYHGVRINPADPATWASVSRNAPCPCGSGKKYKHCHGSV